MYRTQYGNRRFSAQTVVSGRQKPLLTKLSKAVWTLAQTEHYISIDQSPKEMPRSLAVIT